MGIWDSIIDGIKDIPISNVLRERLALAAEQHALLETKMINLTHENMALKTEVQQLKSDITVLQSDLQKAKEKIRALEKQLFELRHKDLLDEQKLADKLYDEIWGPDGP